MMQSLTFLAFAVAGLAVSRSLQAHEGVGRAGLREAERVEVETELFTGKGGYLHGGIGIIAPFDNSIRVGLTAHAVREETGGRTFPSLGAEFIKVLGRGFELEGSAFRYFPVENQSASAASLRLNRHIKLRENLSVSPFFGPAYARVNALDEAAGELVPISHLLLMGGVVIDDGGKFRLGIFASRSFFSRNPAGLETHVDLEEMTHFAAYENNDGFAPWTAGAELGWRATPRLTLTGRYALIRYEDATRHAFSFAPSLRLSPSTSIFAGFQLLRGDRRDDLFTAGVAVSF